MLALFKQWLLHTWDDEYKHDGSNDAVHFSKPCCFVDLVPIVEESTLKSQIVFPIQMMHWVFPSLVENTCNASFFFCFFKKYACLITASKHSLQYFSGYQLYSSMKNMGPHWKSCSVLNGLLLPCIKRNVYLDLHSRYHWSSLTKRLQGPTMTD